MKVHLVVLALFGSSVMAFCQNAADPQLSDTEAWKLGWRMVESSVEENFKLAELQFDSLLNLAGGIENKFLKVGLETKSKLDKNDEAIEILNAQNEEVLWEICTSQILGRMSPCAGFAEEKVGNKPLQTELIRMYVNDQAARGNIMDDIIAKYNIDTSQITQNGAVGVDEQNRSRLKEIIGQYGFPTRKLVGKDAMFGIFLMIQHADGDKEWQRSQLRDIEAAVKNGDIDAQSYAYLYDRIKVNSGEKQLYGTQFAKVDPVNRVVELAGTEDMENLDKRRRELGMMPIGMYKRFVFDALK